jgi:hypothetical protein
MGMTGLWNDRHQVAGFNYQREVDMIIMITVKSDLQRVMEIFREHSISQGKIDEY